MDDLGFPRTPDRPVKLLGTCVRYQRSVETTIDARGPDFLGDFATCVTMDCTSSSPSSLCGDGQWFKKNLTCGTRVLVMGEGEARGRSGHFT